MLKEMWKGNEISSDYTFFCGAAREYFYHCGPYMVIMWDMINQRLPYIWAPNVGMLAILGVLIKEVNGADTECYHTDHRSATKDSN